MVSKLSMLRLWKDHTALKDAMQDQRREYKSDKSGTTEEGTSAGQDQQYRSGTDMKSWRSTAERMKLWCNGVDISEKFANIR